jgi:hypothetical protein
VSCGVVGCPKPSYLRGWCTTHYQRWLKTGDPLKTIGTPHGLTPMERFMRHVIIDPDTGCELWTASTDRKGYAMFGPSRRAARWRWQQERGPIPTGLVLDHFVCDTPRCVNLDHVRPVTNRENVLRGVGITAMNAAKTHCVNGHPYSPQNTYVIAGERRCKICAAAAQRRYRARKRHR